MNIFDPLSLLKKLLATENYSQPVELRRSDVIDKVLERLTARAKAGGQAHVPKDLQLEAAQRFWHAKHLTSFRDARLVSFGLGLNVEEIGHCLLEDRALFRTLLDEISQWRDVPRQFRKCYQGLVRSYFEYDGMAPNADAVGHKNWLLLRTYLQQNLRYIQDDKTINPEWVDCVRENPNLFSDKPAKTYGQELLQDNSERVDQICKLIGISDASWFMRALLIGQIEAAAQQTDVAFHDLVSRLLQRIADNHVVRSQGLRLILERYIGIAQPPLHVELKEYAAQWWGNPWLSSNQSAWGGVSEAARNMVAQWLAEEFINLFFTKLAEDGLGDSRRVKFWQQYVPSINYIRFALGKNIINSRQTDFVELLDKLEGMIIPLEGAGSSNNAFIMGIDNLIAVEFSGQANAFYGYDKAHSLPFDLNKSVRSGPVNGPNSLKNRSCIVHLRHQDYVLGHAHWEDRFEEELQAKFKIIPSIKNIVQDSDIPQKAARSTPNPYSNNIHLKKFADEIGGSIQDNTAMGGALWVYTKEFNDHADRVLRGSGFHYAAGKGWWKK